jgi:enoyl-CoA hydratase/carnithine racemase
MSTLDEYANKYKTVRMERRNGVLQVTLHTDGQSLRWGFLPHGELPEAFHDIGADRENRVVILTGTGAEFSGPRASPGTSSFPTRPSIERIDRIHWEGRHLLMNLLNIEVPIISAINGPAWRHSERCFAASSWRPRPRSSRIPPISTRRSFPATACTSCIHCCSG